MRVKVVTWWGGWTVAVGLLLQFITVTSSQAQVIAPPLTLGWNAAADASIRGYAVYYVRTNQLTATRKDAGLNLNTTLSDLTIGSTYRIYVVSYNAQGAESIPSNHLLFTPTNSPPPDPVVPQPKLLITRLTDGSMRLNYTAQPNTVCAIQFASTPDAAYWQTLTNVTATAAGNIVATDTSAKRVPQRFYRAALSPQPLVSPVTITRLANGHMRLSWMTPPGSRSRVIFAAQPTATIWPTMATVTADDEGRATYVDTSANSASSRFYRVALP